MRIPPLYGARLRQGPRQNSSPKTVTMHHIVLFTTSLDFSRGHMYVRTPSLPESQKQEVAVWTPAPFRCMIMQVVMYLKGFLVSFSLPMMVSQMVLIQWGTISSA